MEYGLLAEAKRICANMHDENSEEFHRIQNGENTVW